MAARDRLARGRRGHPRWAQLVPRNSTATGSGGLPQLWGRHKGQTPMDPSRVQALLGGATRHLSRRVALGPTTVVLCTPGVTPSCPVRPRCKWEQAHRRAVRLGRSHLLVGAQAPLTPEGGAMRHSPPSESPRQGALRRGRWGAFHAPQDTGGSWWNHSPVGNRASQRRRGMVEKALPARRP